MPYEDRYREFEQYLASGEPGVEERARNWSMAIGLQDVDRLKPSEFLLEQAKANIEGKISSEEIGERLEEYYRQKSVREKAEADGTFEADRVADRINLLLAEKAFTFSPMELSRIHGFLFKGVRSHAGQFRTIMNFFTRNLRKVQVEKEFNSLGQLEIPYESLIEYTVNALVHRSLNIKAPIRIFIFDNRVEIHSPGALPNGLSIDDIKNGTSMPRNMFLFTNANYLLPYTGAGSGVRRALEYDPDAVFSNGVDQREITHSANEFVITIPRKGNQANDQVTNQGNLVTDQATPKTDPVNNQAPQNTTKLTQKSDQVSDQVPQNTTKLSQKNDQVSDQVLQNTTKLKLSKKQQDVRNFCSIPRTGKEILQRAGVADHFDSRKRYIYDLVEAGVLERTIPEKPNDPNQKYRRKQ